MKLADARILVTGASSGIGREIAVALAAEGAHLAISGRDRARLSQTAAKLDRRSKEALCLPADLSLLSEIPALVDDAVGGLGGLDAIVHAAGVNTFGSFADAAPEDLEQLVRTNVLSTMELARTTLPRFEAQEHGSLLFVGSIFGSIGFPWFSAYSASKFAVRGFAEALRRETAGRGVHVLYVAPRGTRTAMARQYAAMAEAVRMQMDDPTRVARQVCYALSRDRAETFIGGAERFFVRLNGLLPRFVDRSLVKQRDRMAPFAATPSEDKQ